MSQGPLAEVAFAVPLKRFFDYRVPPALASDLRVGQRVWAPFGRRRQMGMITRLHDLEAGGLDPLKLKFIESSVEPEPVLGPLDIALAHWMARRCSCSVGEALFTVFPLGRKKPPRRDRPSIPLLHDPPTPLTPTSDQTAALNGILPAVREHRPARFLLQGVAASGKTEVYRRTISASLEEGRGAFLLVPEIGLTPQMEDRLRGWFGETLAVWHSDMADGQRWRVWRAVREGRARVIVGPRSALFLPVAPLGVIVVDEEHDPSYKQDHAPAYHARDAAEEKARLHGAVLIAGSATPSLETHVRAERSDVVRLTLSNRVENRPFPNVRLVDMRGERWYLSDELVGAIRDRLANGEQTLLFLNRRGYATRVECPACGWGARCPLCRVGLVLHRAEGAVMRCHTCDHHEPLPPQCPLCGGSVIKTSGRGTQRVAADLHTLFPSARCLRWDRDAVGGRHGHEQTYRQIMDGQADIIIGTQMVAQGHDFPRLTLVGVVDADRALSFPDFRAAERTFQILMQVAGRAGRADRKGDVIIQTRVPDHYALKAVTARDFTSFATEELAFRQDAGYPPFSRLAHAVLRAKSDERAQETAEQFLAWMREDPSRAAEEGSLLGPAPAFHRVKTGWCQWQVVLKSSGETFDRLIDRANAFSPPTGSGITIDIDPEGMA